MKTQEERIAHLEETVYFQDQTIRELNEALTAQQFQMDEMEKRLVAMQTKLRSLLPLVEEGGMDDGPPPHYGSV
ncbi:SlyX family protein [Desulfovibrio mangrovi]|uniref:SlyX family protein n=1 Tax=Desulfovibrio mangrovi TaxID=2976983 RepID=UPI002245C2C1|nr:SlyX family protein [Desulfovibrio mangrovi]UZP68903.1 SlyX family protein [Desulfovibrio mangrovi]